MSSNPPNSKLTHLSPESEPAATAAGQISAIVPARNEEDVIAACIESLASQPEIAEIIAVNDGSTDRTQAILEGLLETTPKLRVVKTDGVPPGWVGKNYAAWLGAAQARLPWLLFTDADSKHLAGSAAKSLSLAKEHDAALVSFSPEQLTRSWQERALIPFIYMRLAARFSYEAVNNPSSPVAAANGQYLMIHGEAYKAVGGHASVAGEVLEDVALAERVKAAGLRLWFGTGTRTVQVRMYRTFRDMWEGWRKNLYLLVGNSSLAALRELATVVPWVPCLLFLSGLRWPVLAVLGLALLLGRHAAYAAMLSRNRFPVSFLIYYVPGVALYAAVLLASWRSYAQGRVSWKGREYGVRPPAAESEGR